MSGSDKKSKFPEAPTPAVIPGNLLSSVAPPTQLPNFVTTSETIPNMVPPAPVPIQPVLVQSAESRPQIEETFSPAIPLSKGEPLMSIRTPEDSQTTQSPESLTASTPELDQIGDIMPGSGLLTWMKGAVSGGLLQRVAERAKSSVDSVITTLDPQMRDYLRSGGDLYIVVASDIDVEVSPIREAFQTVFGKATVVGTAAQSVASAAQPVGYAAAYAAAKQRIAHVRSSCELTNNVPVVAVEGFLHEAISDRWYELSLLVLSQPSLGVELHAQAQGAAAPGAGVAAARAASPAHYAHAPGLAVSIGSIMADSLQVPQTQWQEATTGVSRRETLLLSARSLAGSYKKMLAVSAAEI